MAGSPHLSEDRAPSPPSRNIETTFTLSSLSFNKGKLQFAVYCNHPILWSYCDDVDYENEGACICAFLSLPDPTRPGTGTFWQLPDPSRSQKPLLIGPWSWPFKDHIFQKIHFQNEHSGAANRAQWAAWVLQLVGEVRIKNKLFCMSSSF